MDFKNYNGINFDIPECMNKKVTKEEFDKFIKLKMIIHLSLYIKIK